jgi:hypothetical protein
MLFNAEIPKRPGPEYSNNTKEAEKTVTQAKRMLST